MAELNTLSALLADGNLKAYYRMESGALTTDSSSGGNTLTNNNTVGEGTGKYGGAADFSATNTDKNLLLNSDLGITGGAISIVGWVKLKAEIGSGDWCFWVQEDAGTHTRNEIRYDYNGGTRTLHFSRVKMNVGSQAVDYAITMGTSNWVHLAYTYDGSTIHAYVNGADVGNAAATGSGAAVGVDNFKIGAGDNGASLEAFASILADDVAVFNRELTAAEVLQLYTDTSRTRGMAVLF